MTTPQAIRTILRRSGIALGVVVLSFVLVRYLVTAQDATPPTAVTDLSVLSAESEQLTLSWTAPGDDGENGQASSYDLRISYVTITEDSWATESVVVNDVSPALAGTEETYTVTGLMPSTTYYVALKASDEVPLESDLSNIAFGSTEPVTAYRSPYTPFIDGTATGNRMVDSSSFETGPDHMSVSRLMSYQEYTDGQLDYRPGVFDATTSVHGQTSLRIDNGSATGDENDYIMLQGNWVYLEEGADYTFSYWTKTDAAPRSVVLKVSTADSTQIVNSACSLTTTAWTKCIATAASVPASDDQLFSLLWTSGRNYYNNPPTGPADEASIWFDAIQIEPGIIGENDVVYDYPLGLGIGIAMNVDHPIYTTQDLVSGQDIIATVTTFADTEDGSDSVLTLHYQLLDGYGTERLSETQDITVADETAGTTTLNLTELLAGADPGSENDRGIFKLIVHALGTDADPGLIRGWEESVYGVIEANTSGAEPDSPFGTHMSDFSSDGAVFGATISSDYAYEFQLAEDVGFKWVRDFGMGKWARTQQSQETPNAYYDAFVDSAQEHNIEILPIILSGNAPSWAYAYDDEETLIRSHPYVPYNYYEQPMQDTDLLTTYVTDLVNHYKDAISTWEIDNEPAFHKLPVEYDEYYLTPIADAIRAADPTATIVAPSPGPHSDYGLTSVPFIQDVFDSAGASDRIDVIGQHMYDFRGYAPELPPTYRMIPYDGVIAYDARTLGSTGKELWDTESGLREPSLYAKRMTYHTEGVLLDGVQPDGDFAENYSGNIDTALQTAQYRIRQMLIKLGEGIDKVFEFRLTGFSNVQKPGELTMTEFDYTPATSLPAMNAAMDVLDGAHVDQAVRIPYDRITTTDTADLNDLVFAYVFPRDDASVLTIWSGTAETVSRGIADPVATLDLPIDPTFVTAVDFFGNELTLTSDGNGGALVPVGNGPLYIVSSGPSGSYTHETFLSALRASSSVLDLPDPAENLMATARATKAIDLAWDASPDATVTGYRVYRIKSGQLSQSPTLVASTAATSATDSAVANGPDYAYWVVAVNGDGDESRPAYTVIPSPWHDNVPADLTVTDVTETSLSVSWTDALGEDSTTFQFRTYLDDTETDRVRDLAVDGYVYSMTFDHLTPGTDYTIDVTANDNQQAESASAGPLDVTTEGTAPDTTPPSDVDDLDAS